MGKWVLFAAAAVVCFGADPFVAVWKPVDLEQWKISPGGSTGQSKRYLVNTELVGADSSRNTYIPIDSDAQPRPPHVNRFDGIERRDETRDDTTTKGERIDNRHIRITVKGPKGTVVEDFVVAPDEKTQRITRKGVGTGTGRQVDELTIFQKQDK